MEAQTIKSLDDIRKSDESKYHTLSYVSYVHMYAYM